MMAEGIAEGVRVLTVMGEHPIEALKPGDRVLTHQHRRGTVREVVVLGVSHVAAFTLNSGHGLVCTVGQRVLVPGYAWEAAYSAHNRGVGLGTRKLFAIGGFGCSDEHTFFHDIERALPAGNKRIYGLVIDGPDPSFLANRVYVHDLSK